MLTIQGKSRWYVLKFIFIAGLYFATAWTGLHLSAVSSFAALVWPPTGIAIVAVYFWGEEILPAVFLGAFMVNMSTGAPWPVALTMGFGNALEAVVAARFLRARDFHPAFDRLKDAFSFCFLAAGVATLVSATIGVSALLTGGLLNISNYPLTWLAWWVGDALGALIFAPLFLMIFGGRPKHAREERRFWEIEFVALLALLLVACYFIFFTVFPLRAEATALLFLLFPFTIWTAFRFGPKGTSVALLAISVSAVAGTYLGRGPFTGQSLVSIDLLFLQLYLGALIATNLILAAVIEERLGAQYETQDLSKRLETLVTKQSKKIEQEEGKNQAVLASIGDGVISIDTHERVSLVNPMAIKLLGLKKTSVVGQPYEGLFTIEDAAGNKISTPSRPMYETLKTGRQVNSDVEHPYYYVRPDKTRFAVAFLTTPLREGRKITGVVQVFRDISAFSDLERARRDFIALASHQLRTPLTAMRWYTDLLLESGDHETWKKQHEYLDVIEYNIERMNRTIRLLLDVSRIEMGTFVVKSEAINVRTSLNDVLKGLEPKSREKKIKIVVTGKEIFALGDVTMLRIVLENVVENSLKYSPARSTVSIDLLVNGGSVTITVTDHGSGIAADQQSKIFTKFFRTQNAVLMDPEGSGIGLYLSKTILDRMHGTINFTSKVGVGTTFTIELPKARKLTR